MITELEKDREVLWGCGDEGCLDAVEEAEAVRELAVRCLLDARILGGVHHDALLRGAVWDSVRSAREALSRRCPD